MSTVIEPLLPVAETARIMALSPRTVRRLAASGELPSVRIGASVRFRPSAIADYIAAHTQGDADA